MDHDRVHGEHWLYGSVGCNNTVHLNRQTVALTFKATLSGDSNLQHEETQDSCRPLQALRNKQASREGEGERGGMERRDKEACCRSSSTPLTMGVAMARHHR
jgi:hypothetical protein